MEVVGRRDHVGLDRVAAEEVDLGRRPEVADAHRAVEQLTDRGHDAHVEPGSTARLAELADQGTVAGGDRDHHHGGAGAGGDRRDRGTVTHDTHAPNGQVALGRVVVEERDGRVRAARFVEHRVHRALAALTRAEHDGRCAIGVQRAPAVVDRPPDAVADAPHQDERDDPGADDRADRGRPQADVDRVEHDEDAGREHGDPGEGRDLLERSEEPPPAVEAEPVAEPGLRGPCDGNEQRDLELGEAREVEVESEDHRGVERHDPHDGICREPQGAPGADALGEEHLDRAIRARRGTRLRAVTLALDASLLRHPPPCEIRRAPVILTATFRGRKRRYTPQRGFPGGSPPARSPGPTPGYPRRPFVKRFAPRSKRVGTDTARRWVSWSSCAP